MKILLVNHRFFVSGGPERYMFNLMALLEDDGHEIIPFSVRYARNRPTPYQSFFATPLAGKDAVTFNEHEWTPGSFARTLARTFYSREVEKKLLALIDETKPDVAYVLHFLRKLSPAVLVALKKRKIPIVVRASDFLFLCPSSHFLRDNKPCTLCSGRTPWPSVRYRCVKNSFAASMISFLAWHCHRNRGFFGLIDRLIVTNKFTRTEMLDAQWPESKLELIHTFVPDEAFLATDSTTDRDVILFSGQMAPHKGPDLLIRAYAQAFPGPKASRPKLVLAGSNSQFSDKCRELVRNLGVEDTVSFLGFVDIEQLRSLYRNSRFVVIPSLWYENLPNVLLESSASATPAIAPDHGSFSPYISHGKTGLLYTPGNIQDLSAKIAQAWHDPEWCKNAGLAAQNRAKELFSSKYHMNKLLSVFELLVRKKK